MNTSTQSGAEELLYFTLEGLLQPGQTLIVNPATRTVTLLSLSHTEPAPFVVQQSFSPNGIRLLLPLLEAYPHYCTYKTLHAHLFSLPPEQTHRLLEEDWECAIRPIRRAIGSLNVGMRSFGLRIRNIRSTGYLIEPVVWHRR